MTPDDAREAFDRLERSRIQPRMRVALSVLATGESYRNVAAALGYRGHRTLRRHARRLGFDRMHRDARVRALRRHLAKEIVALDSNFDAMDRRSAVSSLKKALAFLDLG